MVKQSLLCPLLVVALVSLVRVSRARPHYSKYIDLSFATVYKNDSLSREMA